MDKRDDKTTLESAFHEHDKRITNLAQVKQDSRLWSPADMLGAVARELSESGTYSGKRIAKAAVILYADDEDGRGVTIVQAKCSMLELQGLLRCGEQAVDKGIVE